MAKDVVLKFDEITLERKKAIKVKLSDYPTEIWLPKHRIEIDKENRVVKMTQKLADEKLPEASITAEEWKRRAEEEERRKKERLEEIIPLRLEEDFDWEKEKMFGIKAELYSDSSGTKTGGIMIFFPKSLLKNGGVPRWIFNKKVADAIDYRFPKVANILRNSGNGDCFTITGLLANGDFLINRDVIREL
jgi:hypothetical protein